MVTDKTLIISLLGAALLTQGCNSPDKKEIRGDSVVNVGSGMDAKRDTGFTASAKDDAPQDANPGKNLRDYTNESNVDSDDAAFMKKAALGGMMEVDLGKVAQKSANPEVKAFATQMVTDHTKANKELKALAMKSEILLPTEYYADQDEHIKKMKALSGPEFDKHYIDMMVNDHTETVKLFRAATETRSKDLKKFATQTLPVLEGHYAKAKAIQAKLK
jgi:putative membrane protein